MYRQNVRRLLVLPLYPQYSGTSTGSVFDAVTTALSRRRWLPEMHFINHYHDSAGYISAIAASTRDFWDLHGRGERLLFSFHGLPRRLLDKGDPYHCQCQKTARLVAESLELDEDCWEVSFQSRLGRAEWLRPYTDDIMKSWGIEKLGKIDVISPGFAADCLETLEEIAMRYASDFTASGGGELRYIPALNARDDHVSRAGRKHPRTGACLKRRVKWTRACVVHVKWVRSADVARGVFRNQRTDTRHPRVAGILQGARLFGTGGWRCLAGTNTLSLATGVCVSACTMGMLMGPH
jgi:hypothetical protein